MKKYTFYISLLIFNFVIVNFVIVGAPVGSPLVINECLFGDMSNRSCLETTSAFEGKNLWSKPNGNKESYPAQHVVIIGESILVRFTGRLNCFSKKDGELKWSEWFDNKFKFSVTDGMIRTRHRGKCCRN